MLARAALIWQSCGTQQARQFDVLCRHLVAFMSVQQPLLWCGGHAVAQLVEANLSGSAVVIVLACKTQPEPQRKQEATATRRLL